MEYIILPPQVKPKNKLQAAAFEFDILNEHQFRTELSQLLGISEPTLRTMWQEADATKHLYRHVKAVADHFGRSIEELFRT
jgi:hypothetical protein